MSPIFIIFSHGKESGPYGSKIKRLMEVAEECRIPSVSIDYRECENADERVTLLKDTISRSGVSSTRIVLVGSSMGVSTVVANEVDRYLILPSRKSDDIIALIDDKTYHDVFVFYRQKE